MGSAFFGTGAFLFVFAARGADGLGWLRLRRKLDTKDDSQNKKPKAAAVAKPKPTKTARARAMRLAPLVKSNRLVSTNGTTNSGASSSVKAALKVNAASTSPVMAG